MTEAKKTTKEHTFEVLVSFSGLNLGERFPHVPDGWTAQHVESGYLQDVTGEPTVEEAQHGGEVGKG